MKSQLCSLLAVGAAGALIVRRLSETSASGPSPSAAPAQSPYVPVVENVLHQHEGEDLPMVHAFEEALEEERRHEEQLAHDVGVHA